ncbi:MAG: DsrE family protein [Brucellaceae bacterium]|jgi:intracellular sulfur oxidation DsrE/DsrF family protein|nr:DsrE family protein [Brucellaceae bacterium]
MNDPLTQNRYQTTEQRVVYHNNGAYINASAPKTKAYMAALLASLSNHVQALSAGCESKPDFTIHVVSHAAGLDLFAIVENDEALRTRYDALREQGVRFLVCANTMRARNLSVDDLCGVSERDIVPSGVAELAHLQMQGFAYIHF